MDLAEIHLAHWKGECLTNRSKVDKDQKIVGSDTVTCKRGNFQNKRENQGKPRKDQ